MMFWGSVYTEARISCFQRYPGLVFEPGVWSLNLVYVQSHIGSLFWGLFRVRHMRERPITSASHSSASECLRCQNNHVTLWHGMSHETCDVIIQPSKL